MTQQPAPVAAPAPDRAPASDLIAAMRERWPRIALAVAAGQAALPAAKVIRNKVRGRRTYTVKVPGGDDLYDDLHAWVLGLLPSAEQKALVAWTSRPGMLAAPMQPGEKPPPLSLRLRYDGTREQVIMVAGQEVAVMVTEAQGGRDDLWRRPPEILFTATSAAGRDALLAALGTVLERSEDRKRKPVTRMLNEWGEWMQLDELPPRDLDSVILPDGQLERITADVRRWLDSEADYGRRCIPWHRAYLFEGPPRTGKTSAARAIASHFGLDVWYLPLGDLKKDADLLRQVGRIAPRSLLLLEDVDVFHAATSRDDQARDKATLSGLLNALDGIATPHGLLTIMTSNNPDVLDKALVGAGRVDLIEHFGLADADQVRRIMHRWYERGAITPGLIPDISGIAPADVIEACKRHDDPARAIGALLARTPMAVS
jgi:hypothetical protein